MMDTDQSYKAALKSLIRRRAASLYQHLGLEHTLMKRCRLLYLN
nr:MULTISPECIES: hypothetical protein [unclassified Gilliamella]